MSAAQKLQMAIQEIIEDQVKAHQLTDADVIGALRVCLCFEEGALGIRLTQAAIAQMKADTAVPNVEIEGLANTAPNKGDAP